MLQLLVIFISGYSWLRLVATTLAKVIVPRYLTLASVVILIGTGYSYWLLVIERAPGRSCRRLRRAPADIARCTTLTSPRWLTAQGQLPQNGLLQL